MSEVDKTGNRDTPSAAPLNYAPPEHRPVSQAKVFGIAISTCLALFGTVFGSFIGMMAAGSWWPVLISPAVLSLAIFAAVRQGRMPGGKSIALGIWIGIGVALLVAGACFGFAALS